MDKKKKKKVSSSATYTTGSIDVNIDRFNAGMGMPSANEYDPDVIDGGFGGHLPTVNVDLGETSSASGDGGEGCAESLKPLQEKRETKRYFVRPQDIFCANKADVLKALIEVSNAGENCTVYSLKNLDDHEDVGKLANRDIIYYYDDDVLYDKNHVMVMDYDLFIKHEEERAKISDTGKDLTKAEWNNEYDDRMTQNTFVENKNVSKAKFRLKEGMWGGSDYTANEYLIHNVSDGGKTRKYIVATYVDDEYWFYGAWDDKAKAEEVANSLSGATVIPNTGIGVTESVEADLTEARGRRSADYVDYKKLNMVKVPTESGSCKFTGNTNLLNFLEQEDLKEIRKHNLRPDIKDIEAKLAKGKMVEAQLENVVSSYIRDYSAELDEYGFQGMTDADICQQCKAYYEACLRAYFDTELAKNVELRQRRTNNVLDLSPGEIKAARAWLQDNVTGIVYQFPYNDPDNEVTITDVQGKDITTARTAKWEADLNKFKSDYPYATVENDYTLRRADGSDDRHKYRWQPTATVKLATVAGNAPEAVQKLIDNAKNAARENDIDVKSAAACANDRHIDSRYFADAIIGLFHNDLHFYKKSNASDNPFDLTFESYDAFGYRLTESGKYVDDCCICGEPISGYGNNAEPYADGTCCDACNLKFVIPARLTLMSKDSSDDEE